MAGHPYHIVDVFTERPFGGNPLAVFPDARGIPEELFQVIAQEMNLSETTFVLPPTGPACHCKVRIFTPARELPTAGHPTVGTAHVLALLGLFDPGTEDGVLRMEQGVGTVPVTVQGTMGAPGAIHMSQGVPAFSAAGLDPAAVADMLSLSPEDLLPGVPVETGSAGVPFLYVPLASLDAARRAALRMERWQSLLAGREDSSLFLLTRETEAPDATVHGRMFGPAFGIAEDPATGIASGPLGGYLLRHGLVPAAPEVSLVSEQGVEMGRPSRVEIGISMDGEAITAVRVGGTTVHLANGVMHF